MLVENAFRLLSYGGIRHSIAPLITYFSEKQKRPAYKKSRIESAIFNLNISDFHCQMNFRENRNLADSFIDLPKSIPEKRFGLLTFPLGDAIIKAENRPRKRFPAAGGAIRAIRTKEGIRFDLQPQRSARIRRIKAVTLYVR